MTESTVSFHVACSLSKMVTWGEDEYDDDDFYPNSELQMISNHLTTPFPICHLYKLYFYGPLKGGRDLHIFKSAENDNDSIILLDLNVYDNTDQHDIVQLGIKCPTKYAKRVRECLKHFVNNIEPNVVINPYQEANYIKFIENAIQKGKT